MKTLDTSFKGAVFAYLSNTLSWNKQTVRNYTLKICKERFLLNQRVFYFPPDFYIVEEFNHQISLLRANGIIDRLFSDHDYLNVKELSSEPVALNIYETSGMFYVLITGLTVSALAFAAEKIYFIAFKLKNSTVEQA